MIDITVLEDIFKGLDKLNVTNKKSELSLSDIAIYMRKNHKEIKHNLPILKNNFNVRETNRGVYVSLK